MSTIPVPDIPGPRKALCWKQGPLMARCDRADGHTGPHTWELADRLARAEAVLEGADRWREAAYAKRRTVDAIRDRVRVGETVDHVAADFDLPLEWVIAICKPGYDMSECGCAGAAPRGDAGAAPTSGVAAVPADSLDYLECPCCGDVGAEPSADGTYYDGQPLVCGCPGLVSVDGESDPFINNGDTLCGRCSAVDAADSPASSCAWTEDEDGCWKTGCGGMFATACGTPSENGMKCCCYCGKPLAEVPCVAREDDGA